MEKERTCLSYDEVFEGRIDRKFCSDYCKSNYHYLLNKKKENYFFIKVTKQLKLNRRLLRDFNKAGKSTVQMDKLIGSGFDSNFFTHYWKNKKGDVYLFCYEYGFLKKVEHQKIKYVLVEWQEYMEK